MTAEAIVDYVLGLDRDTLIFYLMRDLTSCEAVYEGISGTKVSHYTSPYPGHEIITMENAYGLASMLAYSKAVELYGMDALNKVRIAHDWTELRDVRTIYITHLIHREKYIACPYEDATHIRTTSNNATFEFLSILKESDDCVRLGIIGPKVSPRAVEILLGPNCWFKKCYADIFVDRQQQLASSILKVIGEPDDDQIVYHKIYQINPKASTPNTEHKWCAQIFDVHYGPFDSYKEALDFRPSKMAQPGEVIRIPRGLRRITGTTPLNDGQIVLTAELYELAGYPIPKDCVLAQFDNKLCAVRLSQGTQGQQRGIRYIFRQRDSHKFEWASDGQYDLTHVVDLSDTPARTTWDLLPDIIKEVVL